MADVESEETSAGLRTRCGSGAIPSTARQTVVTSSQVAPSGAKAEKLAVDELCNTIPKGSIGSSSEAAIQKTFRVDFQYKEEDLTGYIQNNKRSRSERDIEETTESFSVNINMKQAAVGVWRKVLQLVEVTKMKGKFWNRHGFTRGGLNYLYPEEALLLIESGKLCIEGPTGMPVPSSLIYESMLSILDLPVYLTFLKLRV